MKNKKGYKLLEHTADLKIQAWGKDLKEAFSNTLKGMFESCQPEIVDKKPHYRSLTIKADNKESLLVDFLSQALYFSDVYNECYAKAQFSKLSEKELKAKLFAYKVSHWGKEIKAVTWHDLTIKKENGLWQIRVLFDI